MYITIEKSNLSKTLSHLYRIVEKKSTIPVLSNIKIEAGDNLKFTATNIDLEIIEVLEATVNEKGSTTIPAHVLYDIVRKLPDGNIELKTSTDNSKVVIKAGNSSNNFSLHGPLFLCKFYRSAKISVFSSTRNGNNVTCSICRCCCR